MNTENGKAEFKKSFRGYSREEVDEYVENAARDIDSLRGEISDLCRKLSAANEEIEKYHREEAVRGDIIKEAKKNADDILNDAKGRAAKVIIRTSRQCNRIVADMVSQVEEQKNIYESAKQEVLRFRSNLFSLYKEHINKINAYSEAAGVFETDALSKSELDSFIKLLGEDPEDEIDDDSIPSRVGSQIEEEVEKIKNNAYESAKEIFTEQDDRPDAEEPGNAEEVPETADEEPYTFAEAEDIAADEPGKDAGEEEPAEELEVGAETDGKEFGFTGSVSEAGIVLNGAAAAEQPDEDEFEFVPGSLEEEVREDFKAPDISFGEDTEEFGDEGEIENSVNEYDGPVSLDDVFGSLNSYNDADFEAVYGEGYLEDEEKKKEPTEEELLERRRRAEDDSNEFYDESDLEFDPLADPVSPTSETGPMFDTVDKPKSKKKRWKIKRAMSITDEFKAVKEEDND